MTRDDRFDQPPWVVSEIEARRQGFLLGLCFSAFLVGIALLIALPPVGAAILVPSGTALAIFGRVTW